MAKLRRISKMSNSLDKQISDWVKGLDYRKVVFALEVISIRFDIDIYLKPEKDYLLEVLNDYIKCEKDLRGLQGSVAINLISNDWVDWFHQSKRHELWFANHKGMPDTFFNIKTNISPDYFKNLICEIDLYHNTTRNGQVNFELDYKLDIYYNAKRDYTIALQYLKHFDWIKNDDENLLNWCLDYLDNKRLLPKCGLTYPDNLADKYDVIMVSIQLNWGCFLSMEYRPLKEKMHKAWTQKKWRDKKRVRKQP